MAAARAAWRAEAAGIDPERLIFIDESGFDTRLTRTTLVPLAASARMGQHRVGTTLIGALGLDGIRAAMTVAAATGTAVFLAFVAQVPIPVLSREKPDAVVVMDNLAAHEAAGVRHALEAAGVAYRYLPAHSPDRNPIEQAWSKLKTRPRARAARSREALENAIPDALGTITPSDARSWFRHAGYAPN